MTTERYQSRAHEVRAHDLTRRAQRKGEGMTMSMSSHFEQKRARATDDRNHRDLSPQDEALNELRDTLDAGLGHRDLSPIERLERQARDTIGDYRRTMDGRANYGFAETESEEEE